MKPGFTIHKQTSRNYCHLRLCLYADYTTFSPRAVELQYQSDCDTEWSYYGGHLSIERAEGINEIETLARLLKRVFKPSASRSSFHFNGNTEGALLALIDSKIPQIAYDSRESRYLPITEIKPPTFHAWRDDYRRCAYTSCHVGCLAETEDEARRLLTIKFAEYRTDSAALNTWLKADRPAMRLDAKPPVIHTAEDILLWIQSEKTKHQPAREQIAA